MTRRWIFTLRSAICPFVRPLVGLFDGPETHMDEAHHSEFFRFKWSCTTIKNGGVYIDTNFEIKTNFQRFTRSCKQLMFEYEPSSTQAKLGLHLK